MVGREIYVTIINFPLVRTPMIAPTRGYKYMKMMDSMEAAGWIVQAVRKRPARMTTRIAQAWNLAMSAIPTPMTAYTGRFLLRRAARLQTLVEREEKRLRSANNGR
jgi:hypothetical protein